MAADGRLVCGSGDHHDSLPKTEYGSLNPEVCELESLHFNGGKLLWSNDLESLKTEFMRGPGRCDTSHLSNFNETWSK